MIETTDVVIVGAGVAGLSALASLAEVAPTARIHIIDNHDQPGGQYYLQPNPAFSVDGRLTHRAEAETLFQRAQAASAQWLLNTEVWAAAPTGQAGDSGWALELSAPDGLRRLRARAVILAVGACERALPFPGWTLPGVLTAGAAQNLIKSQRVLPGRRVVVSGSGPLTWAVAANLAEAGAQVVAVLEAAPRLVWRGARHLPALWGQWHRLREGFAYWRVLRRAGAPIYLGWAAVAARGETDVRQVEIARLRPDWRPMAGPTNRRMLDADTLVVGYGFTPATQLSRLMECRHVFDRSAGVWAPVRSSDMAASQPGVWIAGDGAGIGGADLARVEGQIAGLAVARHLGWLRPDLARSRLAQLQPALRRQRRFAALLADVFTPGPGLHTLAQADTILCRCEDVTLGEVAAAIDAGAGTVNEVKGLTRAGMGFCQGRMCGDLVARAILTARGLCEANDLSQAGAATPRLPVWPVSLARLAAPDRAAPGRSDTDERDPARR